jgi:hypothetical protein
VSRGRTFTSTSAHRLAAEATISLQAAGADRTWAKVSAQMIFEEPRAWTFLAETLIAPLARQAPTFTLLRSARRRDL